MADISFPWEMFMQASQAKNQNRNQMNQDMASMGQSLGQGFNTIGQAMEAHKKKQLLNQIVQAMQTQGAPQQGPPMPPPAMGQIPPGQPMSAGPGGQDVQMPPGPPASGIGGPAQDNSKLIQSLMMQYDPQSAITRMPTPLQQSEIAKNNAMASRYAASGPIGANGRATSPPNIQQARIDAMNRRTDVMGKGVNNRQINMLVKSTNLPLQQVKTLVQNNIRADRAIGILSQPAVTWQSLGFAITDLAAIMQGGVPHVDQIKNSMFPSWKENVAKWQTFASGTPTANVPPDIQKEVLRMVSQIKDVDNEYLQQSQKNSTNLLGPTISGFDKVKPFVEQGTQDFLKGGVKSAQTSKYDPGKEARYQAWKKSQGL